MAACTDRFQTLASRRRLHSPSAISAASWIGIAPQPEPPENHHIPAERDMAARPAGSAPGPTILVRTPFDETSDTWMTLTDDPGLSSSVVTEGRRSTANR